MENLDKNKEIAYKKAENRVQSIKTFYLTILGFILVGGVLVYSNYEANLMDLGQSHTLWMVICWAMFLVIYGIYLFVPFFQNWESRKTDELAKKYKQNN